MRIARLRWTTYRVPFRRPYLTSRGSVSDREGMLIELTSESGAIGLGEASFLPGEGKVSNIEAALAAASDRVIRTELTKWLHDGATTANARLDAAISTAASDAYARHLGVSLARLVSKGTGLEPAGVVAVNALIGGDPADTVRALATTARQKGFGTVKLKVGLATSVAEEEQRVAAARDALGPDIRLRIDANGAWEEQRAIETLRALSPYDIEYAEQPVAPGNLEAMGRVAQAVPGIPIAADEDVTGWGSARRVIEARAARILIVKPLQANGYEDWLQLLSGPLPVVVTTSIDSGVGTALALHLAAATGGKYAHGLATLDLLEDGLIAPPRLPIEDGLMRLPGGAGLGIQLDDDALRHYTDGWREPS